MRRSLHIAVLTLLVGLTGLPGSAAFAQTTTETQVFRSNEPECTEESVPGEYTFILCMEGTYVFHTTTFGDGGYISVYNADLLLTAEMSTEGCTDGDTHTTREHAQTNGRLSFTSNDPEGEPQQSHSISLVDAIITVQCNDGQVWQTHCVTTARLHYVRGTPQFQTAETVCTDPVDAGTGS